MTKPAAKPQQEEHRLSVPLKPDTFDRLSASATANKRAAGREAQAIIEGAMEKPDRPRKTRRHNQIRKSSPI